ncbi:hypothetical protein [Paracoccus sphaerophysae]|uniref:hypothetical protein n=1 Tax=Paracoccus sphaerophysae TaxID=690417 RepID=UPI002352D901|nr:hypothetical protein [Paracoccus sphaerophysae]
MNFSDAFARLGYKLSNIRTDWTAVAPHGVCLSIWKSELVKPKGGIPYWDLFELHPTGGGDWTQKPGHAKRSKHLQIAMSEFGGVVDAVLLDGSSSEPIEAAHPWLASERKGARWKITRFDPASGFFRAEITPPLATETKV